MADGSAALETETTPVVTRRSLWACALGAICFLAIGFSVAAWYRATSPFPDIAVLNEKVADYTAATEGYDIVFLGSSQTFRHIDPDVVEAGLAACGLDYSVYNFGVPALREPEMRHIATEILRAPRQPRLVILQNPIRAETAFTNMMSARGRHFRGGDYAGAALQDVQCYTGTRRGQARSFFNTVRAMLAEGFGLGRLAETFVPTDPPPPPEYNLGYRDNRGFFPVDQDGSDHIVQRLDISPMTEEILDRGLRGEGFAPSESVARCRAEQLTGTLDRFRTAGIATAYYVSPAPLDIAHDRPVTDAVAALNPGMPVLDYNSRDAASRFYQRQLWYDAAHMTGEGAALLSADIANTLCNTPDLSGAD